MKNGTHYIRRGHHANIFYNSLMRCKSECCYCLQVKVSMHVLLGSAMNSNITTYNWESLAAITHFFPDIVLIGEQMS